MARPIIDIGMRIDISDQIADIEKQLNGLASKAGGKMTKEVSNQIAALESELKSLQDSFARLNTSKLSTKTFQAATKEITSQIAELDKRTTALESGMTELIRTMSASDGGAMANALKQVSAQMDAVKKNAQDATKAVGEMVSSFEGSSTIRLSTGQDEGSLKRELKELQQLSQAIGKIRNDDLYSPYKGSVEEYVKEVDALYSKYNDIMNKIGEDNLDPEVYGSLRSELIKTATAFSTLYNSIPDNFFDTVSEKKFSGTLFGDVAEIIKEDLSGLQLEISSRIDAINTSLSNIGNGVVVDNVKNKLTVPLDISTSQTTLLKRAREIVDGVQPYLNNYPLKVQFILQSGYSSKKTNSLLSQMQKEINELPDEVNKSGIQELYDKIAKDFNKELNLRISADALEPTEKKITTTIERIRKIVQEPMKITPEIVLDDTNISEVQAQLNKISKNLSLSIDKLELSVSAKKSAKSSSVVKEVQESNQGAKIAKENIDAIIAKISEVGGALSPITKLLLDIRQLLQLLPGDVGSIQGPINEITDSVRELTLLLQSSIQVVSPENLDAMFSKIQRGVNGISGSLRGKNLDKIKDILVEFKKYRALGGTASVTDLGGAANVQNWLNKHYLDTNAPKSTVTVGENTELSGLLERLNEISEAIAKKTSLFEEEKNSVKQFVPQEVEQLNLLGDVIGVIVSNLTSLNEQLKTRKLASWSGKFKEAINEVSALFDENFINKIANNNALDLFIKQATEARDSVLSLSSAINSKGAGSESSEMNDLADSSSKATQSKKEFAKANAEVVSSIIVALKSIDSEGKAFEGLNKIITKFSGKNGQANADSTVQALERIRDVLKTPVDDASMIKALESIAAQGANLEHLATILKASKRQLENAKEVVETGKRDSKFDNSISSYITATLKKIDSAEKTRANQATTYTKDFTNQITAAKNQLQQLNDVIKNHPEDTPWDESEIANIKSMQSQIDKVVSGLTDQSNINETTTALDKLSSRISKTLNDNTKMSSELRTAFIDLRKRIEESRESIDKVSAKRLTKEFQELNAELEKSGRTGKSFWTQISKAITSQSAQFVATYLSFQDIVRYAREVVTTVTQIDSALTELRKVSDASTERLAQNFEVSAETAKELGANITHVINMTADWSRLGYSVDEAEKLARVTTLFQNVGDNMSADDASSFMISTLQGFQLATEEAERIVDVYNEVANNFAIDTRGIGEAISRSAASFNAANTDLEGAVAVITAANSVVQNPEAIGTAMKTLSARIRGSKVELEELGEEEEDIINLSSKLRKEVQAMTGFDIMADEETYKSIDQIIIGIGKHWKELSDIQQAALAEDLAGKRNSNVLISLLQNAELVEEVYNRALDAEGSAAKEQENYMKSIQYSLDRFTASLQELEADLVHAQFVKDIVDLGTTIVNILDEIVEHIGLLGAGASIAGIIALTKEFKELKNTYEIISKVFKAQNLIESGMIDDEAEAIKALAVATEGLNAAQVEEILTKAGVDAATQAEIMSTLGLSGANATATVSVEALNAALAATIKNMWAFLTMTPVGWAVLAAAAIAGVVVAFDAFTVSVKESQERIDEYNDTIKELSSELEELRKLENKTSYDNKRIEYLEKQLDIQKRLLEVEQQRYYLNLTEKSFGNAFDSDNIATQQARDTNNFQNRNSTANNIRSVEGYVERLVEIQQEIDSLNTDLGNASTEKEQQKILSKIEKLDKERKRIESGGGADRYSDLLDKYQLYLGQEEQLVDALTAKTSSGQNMLTGKARDDAIAELDFARTKMKEITDAAREYEIATNSFDPFNAITGIVSEKAFKEEDVIAAINSTDGVKAAQERLIKQFPFLTSLCEKYGITLEDLASHYWEEKEAIEAVEDAEKKRENSLSTAVSNMNTRILPQFDALEKVYDEIFNGDKEFDLSQIGTDDLESIRSTFEDLDESLNIDWSSKIEDVDQFLSVIGNTSSTASEVQDAFDALATSYFHAAVASGDFTEENAKVLEQMLTEMGVVNAKEVVEYYQALADGEALATEKGIDLSTVLASDIDALIAEGEVAPITGKALALLALQKQLAAGITFGEAGNIEEIEALARAAGAGAIYLEKLARAKEIAAQVDAGNYGRIPELEALTQELETHDFTKDVNIDFSSVGGGKSSAAGSGGEAGDAYVEAFEKELKALEEQRDAGIITEKEFLDRYKALIEKYFKDVDGYGEEYAKRMGDYFQRAISYYESIFSAVGTLLDHRIKAAQEGRDAAVDALNDEKDAALAAYDAQLEAIDKLIDAKQDQLDQLREEHEARQRNINLQKAQYELQRAQNQRTRLIYKGGQLVYDTDKKDIRSAKENLENAEYENAVAEIEKEIKALEKQREEIEKNREAAEKYYTKLIEDTEKYWDTIINALEKQKSKWEELAEIKEIANAYALIQEAGEDLGYSVEDILNDVPGAFEAFRDAYVNILKEANSENQNFLDGVAYATSTAKESVSSALGEISTKASDVNKALEPLSAVSSKVENTATALGNVATNSGTAASNVGTLSSNLEGAAGASEDISKIDSSIQSIAGASLGNTVQAFKDLAGALKDCADALGIGEGDMSAFEKAIDALSNVSLGNESEGAIGTFNKLASAVSAVSSAIGGGNGANTSTETAPSMSDGTTGSGGLIKAIEDVKQAAIDNIGTSSNGGATSTEAGGGSEEEGAGTAISAFDALTGAIGNVVNAIGNTKDDYKEDGTSLVNSIKGLPIVGAEAIMGEDGIKSMFDQLLDVISQCVTQIDELLNKLREFESAGGMSALDGGYTGNVHINGMATGNVHGNAYASGKLGIKKSENALVGEIGQELIYNPATGTYRTVGDHGPEITRLQKGDLIFNAEQTKAIIKHGKHHGNSYAEGSGLIPLSDAEMNLFKTMGNALVGIKADTTKMLEPIKAIAQNINNVTTNNTSTVINISGTSFNVSGVTGEAVLRTIQDQFEGMISNAYQRAMKT